MRATTGSISKALAAAATLVASIAVPALAIQVGALDALGFGAVVQAPQTPSGEVVVATTPAPRRAVVEVRPTIAKKTSAAATVAVVRRSGAAPATRPQKVTGRTFAPKTVNRPAPSSPAATPATPAAPSTPSTPSTPTTPTTTTTTPSTPATPPPTATTPTVPTTPVVVPPVVLPPIVPPGVLDPPLTPPPLSVTLPPLLPRSSTTNLPDVKVEPLVPTPTPDPPATEQSWGGPPSSWATPPRGTTP